MRRRIVVLLAFLLIAPVVLVGGAAQLGSAHPAHRDLLINRTLTEFSSGDFAGDQVTVFGSGAWNTVTGAVQAGGMFLHRTAGGSVVERAPWRATGVESFDSFGGDGFLEGGVLVLDVRIYASGGNVDVNDFTVVCTVGSPPPGSEESVTIESIALDEPIQSPHRFTVFIQGTSTAP